MTMPATASETCFPSSIRAVYSMECDLSAGPRILRTFAADEGDLAWGCFDEFTAAGRVMNYRWLHGEEAARAEKLREIYLDGLFSLRRGETSPATDAALETAWAFVSSL